MLVKVFGKIWKKLPRSARRWLIRRAETSFTISAAGIVTNEAGEVLLLKHVLRPSSGWGLPGGFINAGEQPDDGLRREIREETGLELNHLRLVHARTIERHIEMIFTARAVGTPEVKSSEITELGWFDVDKMPPNMEHDREMIEASFRAQPQV